MGFTASALLAVLLGLVVIILGFVPYLAWSYRRRGTFGPGHAVLAAATAVYALALWTYTILPLPDPELACRHPAVRQLRPFHFLSDLSTTAAAGGALTPVVAQVVLNVALFVPLGMVSRHLFRRGLVGTVLIGLGVSALIEFTQLTGNWGLYPCAYRVMDVDDLIANTAGAAIGFAFGPVLRRVPGQQTAEVTQPQPVTGRRRVLGMVADVLLVDVTSLAVWTVVASLMEASGASRSDVADATSVQVGITLGVAAVYLVLVPWFGSGATVGQRVVLLRPQTEAGDVPPRRRRLVRAAVGAGGYFVLRVVATLTGSELVNGAAWVLALASLALAARGDHRGLSGLVAGLRVVDSRRPRRASTPAERWAAVPELRKLSTAVVVFATLLLLLFLGLLDQARAGVTGVAVAVVLVVLVLGFVTQVALLLLNGLVMARREGRALGNLLALLLGGGLLCLTAATAVAVGYGSRPVLVVLGVAWALAAYLGFVFWAFALYGVLYARRDPTPGADSVVVLGSGIFGTRVPPLLASRLDRGREVLDAELGRGGDAVLVCSGGQGPGEDVPEATAMADYLRRSGTAPERLREEALSRDTAQNLRNSAQLLQAEGRGSRIVVVTNEFHAFRAAIITRELGLNAQVVGSTTARYFVPSAILREFVAVLARHPWPHLAVAAVILAFGGLVAAYG